MLQAGEKKKSWNPFMVLLIILATYPPLLAAFLLIVDAEGRSSFFVLTGSMYILSACFIIPLMLFMYWGRRGFNDAVKQATQHPVITPLVFIVNAVIVLLYAPKNPRIMTLAWSSIVLLVLSLLLRIFKTEQANNIAKYGVGFGALAVSVADYALLFNYALWNMVPNLNY